MVVLTPASPLEEKLCHWQTAGSKALISLGLNIRFPSSAPINNVIGRLYFTCVWYYVCFSFYVLACFFSFNQFCRTLFSNLAAFIRSRFVHCLLQLLVYYVAFCCVVFPFSFIIHWLISAFVANFFSPFFSLPSSPSPILCYCLVACLLLCIAACLIMKTRVVGLLPSPYQLVVSSNSSGLLSHQVMRVENMTESRMAIGEPERDNGWDGGFAMAASLIVVII